MLNIVNSPEQQALQLATQHLQGGNYPATEQLCRQVLTRQPQNAEALHLLGIVAFQSNRYDIAAALIQQAIAINPHVATYHSNLGKVLADQYQTEPAIASCRRAVALAPQDASVWYNLGHALREHGLLDDAVVAFRKALELKPDWAEVHSNILLSLHLRPGTDPQSLLAEHRHWNQQHAVPLRRFIQSHPQTRDPQRRLRIGYVSPDLREHPVGRFFLNLLPCRDQEHFEVFCYSDWPTPDPITQRISAVADGWRHVVGVGDEQLTAMVRQDRIDILVDLTMHSAHNRLLVFARKPAPVQATYLSYCSTTGLETMDYRITDPYLDPPGRNDAFYSEQTIRLPETYWCYHPAIATPDVAPLPAQAAGHVVFGCLNKLVKVSPPVLAAWCDLLRAVPQATLLLHVPPGSQRDQILNVFVQAGIAPERITFVARMRLPDYFITHHQIDIALDPFPWVGGMTTCDALWMGVPVVSLAGELGVSRGGLSILSNIGLPELVAHTTADYVAIAAGLAGDLPRLAELRHTLRSRMQASPLMDAQRFSRHLEAAYRQMWQHWCAGK